MSAKCDSTEFAKPRSCEWREVGCDDGGGWLGSGGEVMRSRLLSRRGKEATVTQLGPAVLYFTQCIEYVERPVEKSTPHITGL